MGNTSSLKIEKKDKTPNLAQHHTSNALNLKNVEELLCKSILDGNVLELQKLIDQGANLNYPCENEYFPLSYACLFGKGNQKIVRVLVENGSELECLDTKNLTPLMIAIYKNHKEVVNYLISKGANVNHRVPVGNSNEYTPLVLAIYLRLSDIAKTLLNHGASINLRLDGKPLIYKALVGELYEVADLMIKKGAQIDERDDHGVTPMLYAIQYEKPEVVRFLVSRGANVNDSFPYKQCNISPLMIALTRNCSEVVKILVTNGANVNHKPHHKPLLGLAISEGQLEMVKIMIDHGASVDDSYGEVSFVDMAINDENYDIAKFLISHGAEFEPEFYYELLIERCHFEMVKYFVELETNNHIKPQNISDILFVHYVESKKKWNAEISAKIVKFLIENGFDINKVRGISALHKAIRMKQYEIAKQLIKNGSKINTEEKDRDTPLIQAIMNRNSELCKLLLNHGADYEIRGEAKLTPLELAKLMELDEIIDIIIEKMTPDKPECANQLSIIIDDCIICCAPRKQVFVFHPCGHAKTCERCSLKIIHKSDKVNPTCPVCRSGITDLKKIFL